MHKLHTKTLALGVIIFLTLILIGFLYLPKHKKPGIIGEAGSKRSLKLYWFIPDGLRADPSLFTIYKWAEEGSMPNLKKMMQSGSYGYSVPVFPGHTPTNFATLLTGSTPRVHGIADGPMHIEGYPLKMVSKGGFSSIAKKVPPIWYTLEENGLVSTIISVPGSTPPELDLGITIRGRWGGWGVDFPAVIFHAAEDKELRLYQGLGNRVFNFGSELTQFVAAADPAGWHVDLPVSYSPVREIALTNWGATVYGCIYDSVDDGIENYDQIFFSLDKKNKLTNLSQGETSEWLPITLSWQVQNDYNIYTPKKMAWERDLSSILLNTEMAIHVIKLGAGDFFRIRFFYNNLNPHVVNPSYLTSEINNALGPMVDFPDSYPPQLIYYPEDKQTFLEETSRSLAWHRNAARYMVKKRESDLIIHDIYTPNQMLTSRWWLGNIDPESRRYAGVTDEARKALWQEVKNMYSGIDAILGEVMENADDDTIIVFSSDHGIVPLDREVRLNNLFAKKGLLTYQINPDTGAYEIDWHNTKVIYLKMDNIYINPDGLAGNYRRASGAAYEELRKQVIDLLMEIKDERGLNPVAKIVKWENAEEVLSLPSDRVGDLVIANKPGSGWVEDISSDLEVFHESLKSGYKQAIIPEDAEGMLTPFLIMGPGVKKNYQIAAPIPHIDQYPTIMTLLNQAVPAFVEGKPLKEIFIGP